MIYKNRFKTVLFFLCLCSSSTLLGQVKLPALVRDSMVVQRDTPLKIWGWAKQGEKVKVSFNGQSFKTATNADGKWMVLLPPTKAGGPYTMDITASHTIAIKN